MAKYHLNPETGNPGLCRATKQCRFEGLTDHFESPREAQQAYEAEQSSFAKPAPSATAMLEPFKQGVERALAKLDSTRKNDGSLGGSSVQSRMKDHWSKAQYIASSYVDKGEDWSARRGYYGQMKDHVMRMRDELGERSWAGVAPQNRILNERLESLQESLSELCGPTGDKKERELGLFSSSRPGAAPQA